MLEKHRLETFLKENESRDHFLRLYQCICTVLQWAGLMVPRPLSGKRCIHGARDWGGVGRGGGTGEGWTGEGWGWELGSLYRTDS